MTEIISNLFGRPRNDVAGAPADSREDVTGPIVFEAGTIPSDVLTTDETVATEAIEAEETADGEVTDEVGEDAETEQDDEPVAADDEADDEATDEDEVVAEDEAGDAEESEESEEPTAVEESEEAEESAAAEEDEAAEAESDEEIEPVAVEEDEPVAVVEDEPVAVVEAEEAEETATPARAAAGARGSVSVDNGVIAKVVTIVAAKIDGVHSLDADGISVEVDGDVASIKVSLVIEFGHSVKALAEQVRTDVIEAVEQFLNFDVEAVDVHVSDIHLPTA